ncbi:MAG TPA: AsmA family protein, partial [Steroidobacteraceae bacterium]
ALLRAVSSRVGRPVSAATLDVQLISLHPRAVATRVTIGNPPWMPQGSTAEIAKLTLVFDLPGLSHSFNIAKLVTEDTDLHLARDSAGRSNWQLTAPDQPAAAIALIIRSLSMPGTHVELDDERRHLKFRGLVSAADIHDSGGAPALRLDGKGELNGRDVEFDVTGDSLATARHDTPYHFSFVERSSGSRLSGNGSLPRPFDFNQVDAAFAATGADLKDLYFLTGVTLVNTGSFALQGKFVRRGTQVTLSDLAVTSGQSDMQGTVWLDGSGERTQLRADLHSQSLRLADLGARAAGRDVESAANQSLLLSNAAFSPSAARRDDATVSLHARHAQVGRVALQAVDAHMTLDHGVIVIAPLLADTLDGKLSARIQIDASKDDPPTSVDLKISDAQVGQLLRKGSAQAPLEGLLRARVLIKGHGSSVHQVASTANGTVSAVLSHGALRSSLAELTGGDLRGLGLLLAKSKQETGVRCGVASFRAQGGTLTAQSLVLDTDSFLISGEGAIHLDSESLDLKLRGRPKKMRLVRVPSQVLLHGTLAHPSAGIGARNSATQTADAALGVLLTPLASILAFVDPGKPAEADCAALAAQPKT